MDTTSPANTAQARIEHARSAAHGRSAQRVHGAATARSDDQIVPVHDSARKSARLIKGAQEIYYPGAPHGITATHQDQVNADLLAFLQN